MPYSNGTLVSDWHKARQAEPKDYDLAAVPEGKKSLHKSTYRHFGTSGNICWSTTTGEHLSQCLMKKQYEDVVTRRSMLHADLFHAFVSNSDLKTTYVQAYPPTDTHDKQETKVTHDQPEVSSKFRKQISQFTDAADYRRLGRNTWQDDRDNRRTAMFKPTNPMGL
ncbi:cilia- and flagella-associated protein 95-like isoform X2 [Conger conger]|uniref:cilia- and flagella-associated protein 95-like isoform X2 n=1 Tax=Conger conger TaxID=82655 RepID=UPI002A59A106|nr:cilia- and flagella-associated protein 95-like isoform X2 [Conger conger]